MGWRKVLAGSVMLLVLIWRRASCEPVTGDVVLLVLQGVAVYFVVLLLLREPVLMAGIRGIWKKIGEKKEKHRGNCDTE